MSELNTETRQRGVPLSKVRRAVHGEAIAGVGENDGDLVSINI